MTLLTNRQAAEQGNAVAQFNLGRMYALGDDVPKDNVEAVKWYRKAAEQGNADAQTCLGVQYYRGFGVPRDLVQAHAWFNVAAAVGIETAERGRSTAEGSMTPEQIAEAMKLARELFAKLPKA